MRYPLTEPFGLCCLVPYERTMRQCVLASACVGIVVSPLAFGLDAFHSCRKIEQNPVTLYLPILFALHCNCPLCLL